MPIKTIDAGDFWYDFVSIWCKASNETSAHHSQETNVKGTLLMTQNFLQLLGSENPGTVINVVSTAAIMVMPTTSSLALSKLVQLQMQRFIDAENPNVVAVSMQPGAVLTGITKPAFVKFSLDTHELAGGTAVVCLSSFLVRFGWRWLLSTQR
jgi:short-subunit dehydrogenase